MGGDGFLLGHLIGENKISMDPKVVEVLLAAPPPQKFWQAWELFVISMHYLYFLEYLAQTIAPLIALLKLNTNVFGVNLKIDLLLILKVHS